MRLLSQRRLVLVLVVLVVLGSVACLVLALSKPGDPTSDAARPRVVDGHYRSGDLAGPAGPALGVAVRDVPLALTYDYRDLASSLRTATATMTPRFARRYTASFRSVVAPAARRRHQVTDATVNAAGVVTVVTSRHVRVLVFLDQRLLRSTANRGTVAPTVISRTRALVDLVESEGTWKVDEVRPV